MIIINITLKFIGTGYNNFFQAYVKVYDSSNNIIYNGYSFNGEIKIFLKKYNVYKIYVRYNNYLIATPIYINQDLFVFNFNNYINNRSVTFLLTDYNYDNLPIEKGEIILG